MAEHIQPITTRMQPACGTEIARNQHVYGAKTAPASLVTTQSSTVAPPQLLGSALKVPRRCLDDTTPGRERFALHLSPHSPHHSLCAKHKHKEGGHCGRFREKLDAVAFWGQASWMFASKETK